MSLNIGLPLFSGGAECHVEHDKFVIINCNLDGCKYIYLMLIEHLLCSEHHAKDRECKAEKNKVHRGLVGRILPRVRALTHQVFLSLRGWKGM